MKTVYTKQKADTLCDEVCYNCGGKVSVCMERTTIPYRNSLGTTLVNIPVVQPVFTCEPCFIQFTNWTGEDCRTAAVEAYLLGRENSK